MTELQHNQTYPKLHVYNQEKHVTNSDPAVCKILSEFLDNAGPLFYQNLAFISLGGSRLYNTVVDKGLSEIDVDVTAIYLCETRQLLGLDEKKKDFLIPCITNNDSTASKNDVIDYTVYEISRFVHLLLTGNPTAVELLFGNEKKLYLTTNDVIDREWELLIQQRKHFITKELIRNMMGYAKSQLASAVKRRDQEDTPHSRKALYHAIRVVHEASRIVRGDEPMVHLNDDDPIRDKILEIRVGKMPFQTGKSLYHDILSELERDIAVSDGYYATNLLSHVSIETKEWLHEWMIRLRTSKFELN
jgi:predicted nucleotidyltransferase